MVAGASNTTRPQKEWESERGILMKFRSAAVRAHSRKDSMEDSNTTLSERAIWASDEASGYPLRGRLNSEWPCCPAVT